MKQFPQPVKFRRLLGPSFIILALGLGSGEVILWPYLSSNFGLGIAWGAVLGITFQFFMNMEIERYALVTGESVFVGLHRLWRWSAWWFICSTFIGFGLPGIIAASAQVFSFVFGITSFKYTAIGFLLLIGIILSVGKTVYGMMESITKTIIFLGIPFILVLTFVIAAKADWLALAAGIAGMGEGYRFWPAGMSLAVFLGAFAYAGAGGNLNLTQSIYIREKGYGMGVYAQKIAGLFRSDAKRQKVKLSGEQFEINEHNVNNFKKWWRQINAEHLLVFWFVGALAMCLLMLLAYSTTFGNPTNAQGIQFVINEGLSVGGRLAPWVGTLFLFVVSVMLFQTQLGILDSTSRIMAENFALKKLGGNLTGAVNLSKIYYVFLWAQIGFGVALFSFNIYEPKFLIVLGAVINAIAMFVHVGLVNWMNYKFLPREFQAALWRRMVILFIFLFFGFFSLLTVWDRLPQPSNERDWELDQQVLPYAEFDGDEVTIYNVRNFTYQSPSEYAPAYYDKTFDLSQLQSVDFILEPFSDFAGAAHTFLSFGFVGDEYVAISIEIRKEKGEEFSAWKGLFNQYEIMYVIADERDAVKLRANYRNDRVYVYPTKTTPEKMRALFVDMLKKANALRERPEFYNTLTQTCTLNIIKHINTIAPRRIPWSYKALMPGYADELAFDLGLIDTDLPLAEAREKFLVNERALKYADDQDFSVKIRQAE